MLLYTFFYCAKYMFENQQKEYAKKCWDLNATLFDTIVSFKRFGHILIIFYSIPHIFMETLNEVFQLCQAS